MRLAFLVKPNDASRLRTIFQINTVIWGGYANGIIPAYRRLPVELKDSLRRTAGDYMAGYLKAFLPDFLVAMEPSLADLVDFPKSRVIGPADVLDASAEAPVGYGLDITALYEELYNREFKFQRRHPTDVILPTGVDPRMGLLGAACFGEFPAESGLEYFREYYRNAFEPVETAIDATNLYNALRPGIVYPRRATMAELTASGVGWRDRLTLFYMDGSATLDLIDFWNLRALGWRVLPLPRQWTDQLRSPCEQLIAETYGPLRGSSGIMEGTTLQCSRSVPHEEMMDFAARLTQPGPESLTYRTWYPRIWFEWAWDKDHVLRSEITAKESRDEVEVIDDVITFGELAPGFGEQFGLRATPRWINIVGITDYSSAPDASPVLPDELSDWSDVVRGFGASRRPWLSREGITLLCEYYERSHRWTLPTAVRVMSAWMKERGFDLKVSGAGRVAREVLRRLGRYGVHVLAYKEVVEQLNRMAHGGAEIELLDQEGARRRRAISPMVSHREWLGVLQRASEGGASRAQRLLHVLINQDVLRLGLRLECTECNQNNWYSLGGLAEELRCDRCLRTFRFPSAFPPRDAWFYRAVGPFATENYAQGSYCVALALRVLGTGLHANVTWVPSFELHRTGEPPLEADFGMFWREDPAFNSQSWLVLGECKSFFNDFKRDDIARMERLAKAFPGAVLAFCTLRSELSAKERRAIARIARAGRERVAPGKSRNPVIVLTGHELFGEDIPGCWERSGIDPAILAPMRSRWNLKYLADVTQQIHLGLESYSDWRLRQYDKHQERLGRRRNSGNSPTE